MSIEIWLTHLTMVLAFMMTPGPSHLLMLFNSMPYGFQNLRTTAAGDLPANASQMGAAGLGFAAILVASQGAFAIVKWLGVAYPIWMGNCMSRQADHANSRVDVTPSASFKTPSHQSFLASAANPKASNGRPVRGTLIRQISESLFGSQCRR